MKSDRRYLAPKRLVGTGDASGTCGCCSPTGDVFDLAAGCYATSYQRLRVRRRNL
jgi:hypothetical protein